MLLGSRKSQSQEQNWCVVLNAVQSEIDKKRIAKKMSETFSLSLEEANDLVGSTPIILLDNLTRQVASKVKQYFSQVRANMTLTNDVMRKRKYYRTVWPEPPSLAFLHDWEPKEQAASEQEALAPDEALNEIRSISKKAEGKAEEKPSLLKHGGSDNGERPLLAELDRWKKQYFALHEEFERLRNASAMKEPEETPLERSRPSPDPSESEAMELRQKLAQVEERYEALKEESREARVLFEEKIVHAVRENERGQEKIKALEEQIQELSKNKQEKYNTALHDLEQFKVILSDLRNEKASWELQCLDLEKRMAEMKVQSEQREKSLLAKLQIAQERNDESESLKMQLQEARRQLEEKGKIQKKAELETKIQGHEDRLHSLIQNQQNLEDKIQQLEESMRNNLAEQHTLEKELLQGRRDYVRLFGRTMGEASPEV